MLALLLTITAGCGPVADLRERFFDGPTPRDRYVQKLEWAELHNSALARDWLAAGETALREAVPVGPSHVEEAWLTAERPAALAWRTGLRRGQVLSIEVALREDSAAQVFLDVHRVTEDSLAPFHHEVSADSAARTLEFEPRRDGEYIVRIQPELLRGGPVAVRIRVDASLAFPVSGRSARDIGSRFGADRDGGRRAHHGVDIFAPRGTAVVAAAPARVSRVQLTEIGGKVVWLRDERRNQSLYYAHLDSQHVAQGETVAAGDTVGFVGNTGNARTTPPHLHFGIYRRGEGPVDPQAFIQRVTATAAPVTADLSLLGAWSRARSERVAVRAQPDARAATIADLPRHTVMRVLAASGGWYRVRLPDDRIGFVAAAGTEGADLPLRSAVLADTAPVFVAPAHGAFVLDRLAAGASLAVLGRFGEYLYVRTPDGPTGWLAE